MTVPGWPRGISPIILLWPACLGDRALRRCLSLPSSFKFIVASKSSTLTHELMQLGLYARLPSTEPPGSTPGWPLIILLLWADLSHEVLAKGRRIIARVDEVPDSARESLAVFSKPSPVGASRESPCGTCPSCKMPTARPSCALGTHSSSRAELGIDNVQILNRIFWAVAQG